MVRQQLADPAGRMRGQTRQDVRQINIRIVIIELDRLDQGHDYRAARLPARKEPANSQLLRPSATQRLRR